MRNRTMALPALLLIAVGLAATTVQAQGTKVGVFDPGRVSEEAAEAKKLQAALQAMRDVKQAEITTREQEIATLQQQVSQQALSLSADRLQTMEIDIQRKLLELNTAKDLASRQLQLEVAASEAVFNDKLRAAISEFGKSQDFALILATDTVAWASNAIDVTTAIIDQFDAMYPARSGD